MTNHLHYRPTHLFTMRLWIEQSSQFQKEVRGRVQHVLSGDVDYFRSWAELTAFLDAKVQELENKESHTS